jgi:hypothetical protein
MAIPKKSGLRKIKIGQIEYYWNFRTDYSTKTIRIRVGEVEDQNTSLLIEVYHVDVWLTIGESDKKHNEIEIVTPGFIRQAADFALLNGWKQGPNKRLELTYQNKELKIKERGLRPATNTVQSDNRAAPAQTQTGGRGVRVALVH